MEKPKEKKYTKEEEQRIESFFRYISRCNHSFEKIIKEIKNTYPEKELNHRIEKIKNFISLALKYTNMYYGEIFGNEDLILAKINDPIKEKDSILNTIQNIQEPKVDVCDFTMKNPNRIAQKAILKILEETDLSKIDINNEEEFGKKINAIFSKIKDPLRTSAKVSDSTYEKLKKIQQKENNLDGIINFKNENIINSYIKPKKKCNNTSIIYLISTYNFKKFEFPIEIQFTTKEKDTEDNSGLKHHYVYELLQYINFLYKLFGIIPENLVKQEITFILNDRSENSVSYTLKDKDGKPLDKIKIRELVENHINKYKEELTKQ